MRLFEGTEFYQAPRCDKCDALEENCTCVPPEPQQVSPGKQIARIRIEKRKKGKVVTLVQGLAEGNPGRHLSDLLSQLKNACGAGGTVQDGVIEIQGEHQQRLGEILVSLGYRVKT